jgi:hypothetical protein
MNTSCSGHYRLLVGYLLQQRRWSVDDLLARHLDRAEIEGQLRADNASTRSDRPDLIRARRVRMSSNCMHALARGGRSRGGRRPLPEGGVTRARCVPARGVNRKVLPTILDTS